MGLVGFYGHGNYGDELFLEVFREHLGSDVDLRPLLDPAGRTLATRLGARIRASDAILIGGGDIMIPWETTTHYFVPAYLRRPVLIAGIGVPTWGQSLPHVVERLRTFVSSPSVRFLGTRDAESTAWIEGQLRPTIPVRTAADLVCGLTLPAVDKPAGAPIFGVIVRSRREPDDLTHVRRLCARAIELGYRVRRIVLATGRVRAEDEVATAALELPDTELVASDDLAVLSRAIGECSAIASMKFHGVVVATMYGVPAIAMMPTTKTLNFMRRIDRTDLLSFFGDPELPSRLVPGIAPIAVETRDQLRAEAINHLGDLRAAIASAVAGRMPPG